MQLYGTVNPRSRVPATIRLIGIMRHYANFSALFQRDIKIREAIRTIRDLFAVYVYLRMRIYPFKFQYDFFIRPFRQKRKFLYVLIIVSLEPGAVRAARTRISARFRKHGVVRQNDLPKSFLVYPTIFPALIPFNRFHLSSTLPFSFLKNCFIPLKKYPLNIKSSPSIFRLFIPPNFASPLTG